MGFFTKNDLSSKYVSFSKSQQGYTRISESILNSKPVDYFDIFLSHSYKDSIQIENLKLILEEDFGYSVYVDWLEDNQLDRTKVTEEAANLLKKRMNQCKCLLFATSQNSSDSKWMPWELGYFDGIKPKKVAIIPVVEYSSSSFKGQEYLGLYPYIDKTRSESTSKDILWVNNPNTFANFVSFGDWLNGTQPYYRK